MLMVIPSDAWLAGFSPILLASLHCVDGFLYKYHLQSSRIQKQYTKFDAFLDIDNEFIKNSIRGKWFQ